MKVIKEPPKKIPWSKEIPCIACQAVLLVEEDDLIIQYENDCDSRIIHEYLAWTCPFCKREQNVFLINNVDHLRLMDDVKKNLADEKLQFNNKLKEIREIHKLSQVIRT